MLVLIIIVPLNYVEDLYIMCTCMLVLYVIYTLFYATSYFLCTHTCRRLKVASERFAHAQNSRIAHVSFVGRENCV